MKINVKKVWNSLVQSTFNKIVWILLIAVFGGGGIAWKYRPGFKKWLTTEYAFTFKLCAWIAICAVISGLPVIVLKIIDLRNKRKVPVSKFLTDTQDIINKICWWVGQQQHFVKEQTRENKLVTWHFSLIDERLGLNPGSTKKFLPALFRVNSKLFNITILNEGEETIAIRYDS